MKRLMIFLLLAVPAMAAPRVTWTWSPPASGAASYNLYQASGSCATAGLLYGRVNAAPITSLTYVQQPIQSSTVSCTYVTAVSAAGVEGPPSPTFQLDLNPPGAPSAPFGTYSQQ